MPLGHCGWSLLVRSFTEFYGEHNYCISIFHRLVDMEGNLGAIRMVRVRLIATRLRGGWYGLTRGYGRLNYLVAPALAGTPPEWQCRPGTAAGPFFVRRRETHDRTKSWGSTIIATPVDSKRKGKDSLYPAWCGGRKSRGEAMQGNIRQI